MKRPARPPRNRPRLSPYRRFALLALLVGGAVAVALRLLFGLGWLLVYLAGVNAATFLLYAYDKGAAGKAGGWTRVPERVLHGAALLGGSPAALLAQSALRHKTLKRPFRTWFVAICVAQIFALAAWAYWRYGGGIPS